METTSFPCPNTTSMNPLVFCIGEARKNDSGSYLCPKCGSSYGSYESSLVLRAEAYRTAAELSQENSSKYLVEANKIDNRLKSQKAKQSSRS